MPRPDPRLLRNRVTGYAAPVNRVAPTFEDTLAALLDVRFARVDAAMAEVRAEVRRLGRALPPQLVPVAVAARLRGVSLRTARRRVKNGEWPVRREGRRVYVDLAATHIATDEEILEGSHGTR